MTEPQSIDWVDLLATLATPLVIAILGWVFLARQKKNELQAARYDSLRLERLEVELWSKVGDGERRGWRIVGVTNLPPLQEE